ncbi:type VI immunity family protein [Acinetobacter soli]|uniref:type VI immunity family protein n=1 Tax=Acinetobacter soli TaxID=487316 RepID=UPI00124FB847|nr:type VI immunity family protein [Acinetobacter soli]
MSTSETFLNNEEILELVRDIPNDTSIIYGEEDQEFGICPYITFYIYHQEDEVEVVANEIIDIYEEFEKEMINKPFKLRYRKSKSGASTWKKSERWRLSRLEMIEQMHELYKKYFVYYIGATTGESPNQSSRWAFCAQIFEGDSSYTTLKLSFGDKWFRENKEKWYTFVKECLIKLNPIQAYSGYEIGTTTNFNYISPEFETAERIFSDYFYGLDIDHPNMNHSHDDPDGFIYTPSLAAGIRTPTWCFLLSHYWIDKLGLSEEQIRLKLNDPRIEITKLSDPTDSEKFSLWIRLGELSLYPVEEGVPDLLVIANELIKPIRCNELKLTTLDAWEDDPNPRFDIENSPKWIARFDADSDWPEGKRVKKIQTGLLNNNTIKVLGGETCPQTGEWYSPANNMEKRYFEQGEIMPQIENNSWGETIWYLEVTNKK